jgi:site-specific DNA-cytosine methylase
MHRSTRTGGVTLDMKMEIAGKTISIHKLLLYQMNDVVTIIHTIPNRVNGDYRWKGISMSVYYNDNNEYCCKVLQKNIALGHLPGGLVDGRDIREVAASDLMGYQHIHLFAGIGGFPLGLNRAHVPLSLRTLTGGFPCQDISGAGKRAGITGERSGLWKEMFRLIQESIDLHMGYDYILVENVAALVNRGLSTVLGDLASCGYDAEWACLRASDVGAPHQRERIFIVAYPNGVRESRQVGTFADGQRGTSLTTSFRRWKDSESVAHLSSIGGGAWRAEPEKQQWTPNPHELSTTLAHTQYSGCQGWEPDTRGASPVVSCGAATSGEQSQSELGRDVNGIPTGMDRIGVSNGTTCQTNTRKVLPQLRQEIGTQTIQRQNGGYHSLSKEDVLRSGMSWTGTNKRNPNAGIAQEEGREISRLILPRVLMRLQSPGASSRQQSFQQQPFEPDNLVQFLSHEMALAEWETSVDQTIGLQVLRSTISQIKNVSKTFSTLQEVWQSLSFQEKSWVAMAISGRTPFPSGPGEQQHEWEPPRVITTQEQHRVARLEALGNSIVPQLVQVIGESIVESECVA